MIVFGFCCFMNHKHCFDIERFGSKSSAADTLGITQNSDFLVFDSYVVSCRVKIYFIREL